MDLLSLQLLPQLPPPQQRQIAAAPPLSHSSGQPLALRCFPMAVAEAKTRLSMGKTSSSIVIPCRCSSADPLRSGSECSSGALGENRRWILGSLVATATALCVCDIADAVSSSRRALRASKIPETDFTTLPNGLKYYDLKVGAGAEATKGSRVAVHYVAKWKGITFMTSRQGLGVGGGTPYGFDVGQSERGSVMKGLDFGVLGMKVGGQRLLIVPPELAYGKQGVQEIPPNATIELDVELLAIKQSPFGTGVKLFEG